LTPLSRDETSNVSYARSRHTAYRRYRTNPLCTVKTISTRQAVYPLRGHPPDTRTSFSARLHRNTPGISNANIHMSDDVDNRTSYPTSKKLPTPPDEGQVSPSIGVNLKPESPVPNTRSRGNCFDNESATRVGYIGTYITPNYESPHPGVGSHYPTQVSHGKSSLRHDISNDLDKTVCSLGDSASRDMHHATNTTKFSFAHHLRLYTGDINSYESYVSPAYNSRTTYTDKKPCKSMHSISADHVRDTEGSHKVYQGSTRNDNNGIPHDPIPPSSTSVEKDPSHANRRGTGQRAGHDVPPVIGTCWPDDPIPYTLP
jgi:hypothetical protein